MEGATALLHSLPGMSYKLFCLPLLRLIQISLPFFLAGVPFILSAHSVAQFSGPQKKGSAAECGLSPTHHRSCDTAKEKLSFQPSLAMAAYSIQETNSMKKPNSSGLTLYVYVHCLAVAQTIGRRSRSERQLGSVSASPKSSLVPSLRILHSMGTNLRLCPVCVQVVVDPSIGTNLKRQCFPHEFLFLGARVTPNDSAQYLVIYTCPPYNLATE